MTCRCTRAEIGDDVSPLMTSDHTLGCDYPWISDQGDGTYRNPILCADYSDPDVIRVGDDFWMTASSFNCAPGLPILHSRDLVNWSLVNHALPRVPGERYDHVQHGCGVWAPAIRFHAGKFWIFFPTPDEGIYVITADDPRGTWSEPHLLLAGKGLIDPCPLWDEDGRAYLVHAYANSRAGIKHKLHVREMSPDARRIADDGKIVFDEPARYPTLEGPKFHKRNGWYYISAPAGGVATGWQVILRSRDVYGPYEDKIVLAQRDTPINGPHQGALVDTPPATGSASGEGAEWWFVHFQEHQPCGRIVHLQPVRWKDDWPLIGIEQDAKGAGKPALRNTKPGVKHIAARPTEPATSDEFDSGSIGLQWQWQANPRPEWSSTTARPGWLRLFALDATGGTGKLVNAGNLLLQKLPAESFVFDTRVDLRELGEGARAGVVVAGKSSAALLVQRGEGQDGRVVLMIDDEVVADEPLPGKSSVRLRITMVRGGVCFFSWATGAGEMRAFPRTFQAVEGQWIGAKVGLCCLASQGAGGGTGPCGYADFEYARFSSLAKSNESGRAEGAPSSPRRRITESWIALLAVTAIALYLCWLMVQPFVGVILWATVLAIISYPYYLKWRQRGWNSGNAALLSTGFMVLMVMVPLALVVLALVRQAVPAAESVQDVVRQFLSSDSALLARVERVIDLGQWRDPAYVGAQLKSLAGVVGTRTLGLLGGVLGAAVQVLLVLFALYYMLRDADKIVPAVRRMLPLEESQALAVFKRSHEVISASIRGVLVISGVQGALGAVGLWALGFRSSLLWGVVIFLVSMIPMVGASPVLVPAAIYLFATGHWIKGIILVVWGVGVVGMMDNLLRPRLVGERTRLHELVIFFSVLGGLQVFGVLGLIVGPVVVAVTMSLIDVMRTARSGSRSSAG